MNNEKKKEDDAGMMEGVGHAPQQVCQKFSKLFCDFPQISFFVRHEICNDIFVPSACYGFQSNYVSSKLSVICFHHHCQAPTESGFLVSEAISDLWISRRLGGSSNG